MIMKLRSKSLRVFCLIIFALSLYQCTPTTPIRIGFAAELTGRQNELAINLRDGILLAAEEVNASGGIYGRPIEVLIEDDLGTPQGAQEAANKLIDNGAIAIIGNLTSAQTVVAYPVTENRGIVLLSATASTSVLSGKKDLFFKTTATNDLYGTELARYIYQQRGLSRVAIIADQDNDSYTEPIYTTFKKTLKDLGGQVTRKIDFSGRTSPDFSPLVDDLIESDTEGILIIASATNTATIAQQTRLKGWGGAFFAVPWAQGDDLIRNGGKAVEGLEMIMNFDVNIQTPAMQKFKESYQKRFARPPVHTAMYGYEIMQLLIMALRDAKGESGNLLKALSAIKSFEGFTGTIQMDEYGDAIRPLFIQQVKNKQFVTVMTIKAGQ